MASASKGRIRAIRDVANKEIENLRAAGGIGASLQAALHISAQPEDYELLASLEDDLKYVFITSAVQLQPGQPGQAPQVQVSPAAGNKCAMTWHYSDTVGQDAQHPTLSARAISNLFGAGEVRRFA